MFPHIHIGSLDIPTFGLMMMLGMLVAFALIYANRKRIPYTEDDLVTMALYAIIGGFIGSKLLYWIVEFDRILADPHFLLETLTAGFVFYGALILGSLSVWFFTHRKKQCFFAYADLVMPAFILAQGFGRIGCFCAGCCYGAPTASALGVVYPAGSAAPAGIPLLPTQLFESAFCFLFAALLTVLLRKQKRYGLTTGVYLVGYGMWRFVIEFFRSDDRGAVGALSTSQFIGIFIILAGIALLLLVRAGKTPLVSDLMAAAAKGKEEVEEGAEDAPDGETPADDAAEEAVEDNVTSDDAAESDLAASDVVEEAVENDVSADDAAESDAPVFDACEGESAPEASAESETPSEDADAAVDKTSDDPS